MAGLSIPDRIYDYLLFYECANTDWISGTNKMKVIKETSGKLPDYIDWSVRGTDAGDGAGETKCGVIPSTWANFYGQCGKSAALNCTKNVNTMDRDGWGKFTNWWWATHYCDKCANVACAIVLFQAAWGGWKTPGKCLEKLKEAAKKENPSYEFKGSGYAGIANATHAFKNPMDAFQIIRNSHIEYIYDLSSSGKNSKYRVGWMRREVATFQDDGLYVEPGIGNLTKDSNKSLTIDEWKAMCIKLKGQGNYIKLCDWDNMPTTKETFDINVSYLLGNSSSSSSKSSSGSSLDDDSPYVPKFSTSMRNDPHLSAHKDTVIKKGILLGSEFKVK